MSGIAQNKSGNNELVGAAVATLVIIIVLMIALMVGSELEDATTHDNLYDNVVVTNESFGTSTLDVWVGLTYGDIVNGSQTVTNMTYTAVASADYWVNDSDGAIYVYNGSTNVVNETINTTVLPNWVSLANANIINKSTTITNMTYTADNSLDYWVNDTDGKIYLYNKSTSGDLKNHSIYNVTYDYDSAFMESGSDYNITYTFEGKSPWGNVTDKTGELGETGSSILKVGIILSILFAAVGFLIYPYIGGAPGGRGGRKR